MDGEIKIKSVWTPYWCHEGQVIRQWLCRWGLHRRRVHPNFRVNVLLIGPLASPGRWFRVATLAAVCTCGATWVMDWRSPVDWENRKTYWKRVDLPPYRITGWTWSRK